VEAVFHDSAFPDIWNLPAVGTKFKTDPPAEFCLELDCEAVELSIMAITETKVLQKKQKMVWVRYQRLVSYPATALIWKATATFRTVGTLRRFPQCLSQLHPDVQQKEECVENMPCAVCLAPQVGAVIEDCSDCLDNFADSDLNVSTTVHFSDHCFFAPATMCGAGCTNAGIGGWTIHETNGCMSPWDPAIEDSHKLHPVTNHHAPYATMLPVVTVPRL